MSRNAPRGLLIEGDAFVDQFTQDKVADAQRIRVADLVDVREDPSITAEDAGAPVRSAFFDYVGTPHGVIIRESGYPVTTGRAVLRLRGDKISTALAVHTGCPGLNTPRGMTEELGQRNDPAAEQGRASTPAL